MMGISRKQSGFTMIELIVALALGLVLVSGTVLIFVQNNRSATQDEEISRVLENGRYAMRLLARELAMSGFWGRFLDIDTTTNHASVVLGQDCGDGSAWITDPDALQILNSATAAGVAAAFECLPSADVVVGTDVIAIKRTADAETDDADLVANELYLRTNGVNGQFFLGGGASTPPVLTGTETNWLYLPRVYYIRDYSVTNGDDIPAFCRAYLDSGSPPDMTNECLVEGIENLQIQMGVDNDDDFIADYYTATPTVAEVFDSVSARIWILARSVNSVPGYTNDKSYTLGGVNVAAANDGFYRRVFTSTIVLRNPANLTGL